ncbi:hypothetical protein BHE74_00015908 [Ensete ventricosum]|nr:hypothetical protein BHE74_00015908 [Ensete ventricosum]
MWKTGKWLRSFLTGKKDGKKEKAESSSSPLTIKSQSSPISVPAPKEKRSWSYPRWAAAGKSLGSPELSTSVPPLQRLSEAAIDNKRHAMAVAVATAAAADAAVAAAQAAAAVVRLTTAATKQKASAVEQDAATKIQSAFRAYLVDQNQHFSPAPSALTEMSGRDYSGHFEDFSFITAQSSPQYLSAIPVPDPTHSYGHPFFPNYMANTESSRAKARSQSAPRQRTDTFERQTSRRRSSTEGRNIPRVVKMQRSSSHVGLIVSGYQYPLSFKLDKSSMSLKDSECGSMSTVLTNTNYCS